MHSYSPLPESLQVKTGRSCSTSHLWLDLKHRRRKSPLTWRAPLEVSNCNYSYCIYSLTELLAWLCKSNTHQSASNHLWPFRVQYPAQGHIDRRSQASNHQPLLDFLTHSHLTLSIVCFSDLCAPISYCLITLHFSVLGLSESHFKSFSTYKLANEL